MNQKRIIIAGLALLAILACWAFLGRGQQPVEKPTGVLYASTAASTAAATSTLIYQTAGTATSTLVFDSFTSGNTQLAESAMVFLSQYASSSSSTLLVNVEHADTTSGVDCVTLPGSCDWFPLGNSVAGDFATSSKPIDISQTVQYKFNFASSTAAGLGATGANAATSTRTFQIATPTRYTRLVFSTPIGSTPLGFWAKILPIKSKAF